MTIEEFIAEWESSSPFIEVHTSGSTGTPKTIRLSKSMVRESAARTISFFKITSDSNLHLPLSADYIAGKMMIVRALESGAKLTWEPPSNRILRSHSSPISLLAVVPSQLEDLIKRADTLPKIENIIVGGSPLNSRLVALTSEQKIASNIYETYGMTETASHIALRKIDGNREAFRALNGISIGLDDRGCLTVSLGNGTPVIITNDLAAINDDGSFTILGRIDNVIISGAKKIFPEEVEAFASPFFPNYQLAATSRPSEKWGEELILVLAVENNSPASMKRIKEYMEAAANNSEPHMIPKSIITIHELPRNCNGKIDRKALKKLFHHY